MPLENRLQKPMIGKKYISRDTESQEIWINIAVIQTVKNAMGIKGVPEAIV